MQSWAKETLDRIVEKYTRVLPDVQITGEIPYKSENGRWIGSPFDGNGWWTGGFWPGLMWQLYAASSNASFMSEARRAQRLLTSELSRFTALNHDVGFMYLLSTGADYKLTGNEPAAVDTLHAATLLLGRYNPVGYLRAWNDPAKMGYAIIDCMMNLSLLFWASRYTGDPRFEKVARIHADTSIRHFVREDGSCHHIVDFDPMTGAVIGKPAGQGYAEGSSWSRGQAWGLYGFTLAAINTGDESYLDTARRIADYFVAHIRPDGLTDCDFVQPKEPERIDNIAGACAACGLIELAKLTGDKGYHQAAEKLLMGLLEHCCDWSSNGGILTRCTASYHDDGAGCHTNITYGDYFFTEAIAKLCGADPMLWQ